MPILQGALANVFPLPIPMYFWKSKEGNALAQAIHGSHKVRLLAFFARRPKLDPPEDLIGGKLNQGLFEFGRLAATLGIMTVAGFPVVRSLPDLYRSPRVLWFTLDDECQDDKEFYINQFSIPLDRASNEEIETLSIRQLVQMVGTNSRVLEWDQAVAQINTLRNELSHGRGFFSYFGGYKPVYFLIPTE